MAVKYMAWSERTGPVCSVGQDRVVRTSAKQQGFHISDKYPLPGFTGEHINSRNQHEIHAPDASEMF